MLNKLTDMESLGLRGVLLGGILTAGYFNLEETHTSSLEKTPSFSTTTVVPNSDELETAEIGQMIRELFVGRELSPAEEAEPCVALMDQTEGINPNEDPLSFLDSIEAYQTCRRGLSLAAGAYLGTEDAHLEVAYHHLMRCTLQGEDFHLEDLERCEVAEDNFADFIDEQMIRWGWEGYDHEYFEEYREEALYEEKSGWIKPGHAFSVESADGAYEGTFQFNAIMAPDGEIVLKSSMLPKAYGSDPNEIINLYHPLPQDSIHKVTSKFFHSAQSIEALSGSELE